MQTSINNRPQKYFVYELDGEKFFISAELVGANSPMTARSYIMRALSSVGESQNLNPNTAYPNYLDDKDFYDENLNDILVEVLHFFCTMCHKYIRKGDKIPVRLVRDLFIVATSSPIEQEWERMIANSLSYIPLTLADVKGGENVSTALFTAIISTAFDYEMDF